MIGAGYFLGVGSNVEPARNIALALEALVQRYGSLHSSAIHLTEPVAVQGDRLFRNLVVFLPVTEPATQLKAFFNELETRLGRDRSHPQRKHIARPVDLDILRFFPGQAPQGLAATDLATEPYFLVAIPALLHYLGLAAAPAPGANATETLRLADQEVGSRPFSLHTTSAGRIVASTAGPAHAAGPLQESR